MAVVGSCIYARWYLEGASYWGSYPSPVTSSFYTVFTEAGSMTMDTNPQPFTINTAGCGILTHKWKKFVKRKSVAGSLKTPIWPSQSQLIAFATTPQLVGGRYQLPSYTVDMFDGFEIRRFTGVRVTSATFTSDDSSDMLMGSFTLIGKQEVTPPGTLTAPNPGTDFPIEIPYTHYDSSGYITVGGTVISGYKSVELKVDNTLHMPFLDGVWINRANLAQRATSWQVVLSKENTTYRQAFTNQTVTASCLLKYTHPNGTNSVTFNLQNADYLESYSVDRNWDSDQYETLSFQSFLDPTSATDLAVTIV